MTTLGFYNFSELHNHDFQQKVLKIYSEIIKENSFIEGKYNYLFEQEFSKLLKVKHCLLVSNGTDAIEVALIANGIKPGDKVGVPGITFWATAEAILNIGCIPVFIDVDPVLGLLCPKSLQRIIEQHKIKAVVPVHIYGLPAPISEIEKICTPLGIKIIEDAAQAQGGFYDSSLSSDTKNLRPIGSSSNTTTFSFYPTKNLGAFGDAGAITTQSDEVAQKIKLLRNHGRGADGKWEICGRNARCDHLQAAVLYLKLEQIESQNEKRKQIALDYIEQLSDLPLRLVPKEYVSFSSWHLFPIGLKNKTEKSNFYQYLKKQGISSMMFYERCMADEVPLQNYEGESIQARQFSDTTLCLPIHPFLTKKEIELIVEKVRCFLKS